MIDEKEELINSNDKLNDELVKNNVPVNIGYSITAVFIGIYFIIQSIRNKNFDYVCFSFICLPYCIGDLLIGIKEKKLKSIIFNSIIIIILITGYIMSLIGIGTK